MAIPARASRAGDLKKSGTRLRAVPSREASRRLLQANEDPSPRPLARSHATMVAKGDPTADDAARHIRELLAKTLVRGMEDVGAYLLKTYYEDDPRLYRSPSSTKHVSLRLLAAKCGTMELPVSATFLSSCIRMAVVARGLPRDSSFGKLPVSHRIELLRLPDEKIEPTAASALKSGVAVRELRASVTTLLASKPTSRGRPRTPALVRASLEIQRALAVPKPLVHRDQIAALTPAQKTQLRSALDQAEQFLAQLREALPL